MLLPSDRAEPELEHFALWLVKTVRKDSALVLSHDDAIFYDQDGGRRRSDVPPFGGIQVTGRLPPPVSFPLTPEDLKRHKAFHEYLERM
jgi:hypothetical protein